MQKSLGERLKLLRDEKKISIAVAAAEMEISQGVLSDYERDKKLPGYEAIKKMSHYYDVPYDYLFCETDCRERENMPLNYDLGIDSAFIDVLKAAVIERKLEKNANQKTTIDAINTIFLTLINFPKPIFTLLEIINNDEQRHYFENDIDAIDNETSQLIEEYNKKINKKGVFISNMEYSIFLQQKLRDSFIYLSDKIIERAKIEKSMIDFCNEHNINLQDFIEGNVKVTNLDDLDKMWLVNFYGYHCNVLLDKLTNKKQSEGDSDNGEH